MLPTSSRQCPGIPSISPLCTCNIRIKTRSVVKQSKIKFGRGIDGTKDRVQRRTVLLAMLNLQAMLLVIDSSLNRNPECSLSY